MTVSNTPLPVIGSTGTGAVVPTTPLFVGGVNNSGNTQPFLTDAAGSIGTAGSSTATDGRASAISIPIPSGQPWGSIPYWFNGTTMDRQFYCNATQAGSVTASGATQILALVAAKSYRICAFRVSTTPAVAVQLTQGTGANCGTGTAGLSVAFLGVTNIVLEPGASAAYKAVSANAVCITLGAAQTANYDISFANF